MTAPLRVFLVVASSAFLFAVALMVRRNRVMLKYSMLWLLLGVLGVLLALFPEGAYVAAAALGFETASNFVFVVVMLVLLAVSLVYCVALSKQSASIRNLTQELSILRSEAWDRRRVSETSKREGERFRAGAQQGGQND